MKRSIFSLLLICLSLQLSACSNPKSSSTTEYNSDTLIKNSVEIPYCQGNVYFIKNTVKNQVPARINSQSVFNQYFGYAYTASSWKNRAIDFEKEEVLVYDAGVVQRSMEITPVALRQDGRTLHLFLKVKSGAAINYSIHPFLMLIIDKNKADKLIFHVQQEKAK